LPVKKERKRSERQNRRKDTEREHKGNEIEYSIEGKLKLR
jgi:hypothetical protein